MSLTLRYAARSDRGLIRGGNQDSVYAGPRLLAVADGMGGMAAGDVASNIVIATMAPLDEDVPGNAMIDTLKSAVDSANQQIRDAVDVNPAMEGMGTTLTGMLFSGSKIGLVHIGDSRAYLLRDGEFTQITKDDTYVQMLVDEGRISLDEASSHPQRSLLTRALDGRDADPKYSVSQAIAGDRYLLCSDGLSGVVSAETIDSTLRQYTDLQQCAERLIQLALRGGGPDNITVIVADVTDGDIVEAAPIVGGAAARDRGMATSADDSMSSARASALAKSQAEPEPLPDPVGGPDEDDGPSASHPVRTVLMLVILLALLGAGLWGGWWLTQSRYYVGATEDGVVAIFRGVPANVAGLRLSTEYERSATRITDLTPPARDRVQHGIPADDQADAKKRLADLTRDDPTNTNLRPLCRTTPLPGGSTSPSGSSAPSGPAGPGASASGSPSASAGLTPTTSTGSPASSNSAPASASSATPAPNASSDCRDR